MQASNFGGTFDQLFLWIVFWNFHRRCVNTMVQKSQKWPKLKSRGGGGPALSWNQKINFKAGVDWSEAWFLAEIDFNFLHQSVPLTSEICCSKFQRCSSIRSGRKMRGKNDRFDPLGGTVPGCCTWQGIATRVKQQEKSGCCRSCRHPLCSCTILGRRHWQASKKRCSLFKLLLVKHHLAWGWSLSSHYRWCRRAFKETSAVHLRRPVRTPPFRRRGLRLREQAS